MATTQRMIPAARTGRTVPEDFGGRSISELDEAHRRLKRNMHALGMRLRLQRDGEAWPDGLSLLTELENRLQAMAAGLRSRCRAGNFDQIELAIYLRHATRLWNTPPGGPSPGGWCFDANRALVFRPAPEQESASGPAEIPAEDLEAALESMPHPCREAARRALYACAVAFPPWFFNWRAFDETAGAGTERSSEVRVRVSATPAGLRVEVSLSGAGPGLPPHFREPNQRRLAAHLASVLSLLEGAGRIEGADATVEFEVEFTTIGAHRGCSAAA